MPYAINLRSDSPTSDPIRALWRRWSVLETAPSMEPLHYPPHITLAIYDTIPEQLLFDAFDAAFMAQARLTITFSSLGYFETPNGLILWAAPQLPARVRAIHQSVHSRIGAHLSRPNYRPDKWVPHTSIATNIPHARKAEVLAAIEESFVPISAEFHAADCASFLPVTVLREVTLAEIPAHERAT